LVFLDLCRATSNTVHPPKTRTQTPPPVCKGVHFIEAWTQPASWKKIGGKKGMHIFMNVGGRKVKGKIRGKKD